MTPNRATGPSSRQYPSSRRPVRVARGTALGGVALAVIAGSGPALATSALPAGIAGAAQAAQSTAAGTEKDSPAKRNRQSTEPPKLTVNVTDSLGQPVPEARVTFLPYGLTSQDNARSAVLTLVTTAKGAAVVPVARNRGLAPGRYAVHVRAVGQPWTWFPQAATPEAAAPVVVQSGVPEQQHTFTFRDSSTVGAISGSTRFGTSPAGGVMVSAVRAFGGDVPVASVPTDAAGRFTLHVPPGRYKIVADGATLGWLRRWSGGRSDYENARSFAIETGDSWSGVRLNLDPMSTLPRQPRRLLRAPRPPRRLSDVAVDRAVRYQPQRRCRRSPQAGTLAVRRLLLRTYGREEIQMMRGCGVGDTSEHKDGRAMDWMVRAWRRSEAVKADNFARWATRSRGVEHGAMARRLGIMYIIWRGRIWGQYDGAAGWRVYRRCDDLDWPGRWSCHFDHMHISLNKPGARKVTSWWTGRAWR